MYTMVVATYFALSPHSLYTRTLKGGNYSYHKIVTKKDGTKRYKSISQEEYKALCIENREYYSVKKVLHRRGHQGTNHLQIHPGCDIKIT